ncbi:MAG: hypothetical protein ACTSR2_13195 [Candidatus Hodarchaeales archaeon]
MTSEMMEIIKYEGILNDILSLEDKEKARLLLHVILQGGFITKDTFYEKISMSRPTLIKKVASLIKKGYLRQNEEFNPIRITLLVNYEELSQKIAKVEQQIVFARDFLVKMEGIKSRDLLNERFKSAVRVLLGNVHKKELLIEVLSILYVRQASEYIGINELNDKIKLLPGEIRPDVFMNILNCNSDLFYVFSHKVQVDSDKHQKLKKKYFIKPKYRLSKLAKLLFIKRKFELRNYKEELGELFSTFKPLNYDLFPHQLLTYSSNIKQRINSCLKFYSRIDIIFNRIYEQSFDNFIKLIVKNNNFSKHHRIRVLSDQELSLKSNLHLQVTCKLRHKSISKDYKERDIILFSREDEQPYGAIIFPQEPLSPYYLITPHALDEIYTQFKQEWG